MARTTSGMFVVRTFDARDRFQRLDGCSSDRGPGFKSSAAPAGLAAQQTKREITHCGGTGGRVHAWRSSELPVGPYATGAPARWTLCHNMVDCPTFGLSKSGLSQAMSKVTVTPPPPTSPTTAAPAAATAATAKVAQIVNVFARLHGQTPGGTRGRRFLISAVFVLFEMHNLALAELLLDARCARRRSDAHGH